MAQLVLELPQELRERIEVRSCEVKQKPERFVLMAIEQYLEDLEDAEEAQRVVAEIDAGRMATRPWGEVRARLGLDD